jgi:hypothetical protein
MTNSIGVELTRLHADPACIAQPTCARWVETSNHQVPDYGPASILWDGDNGHSFTTSEQDTIIARARTYALSQVPAGKRLYRLTFTESTSVPDRSGPSHGYVFATAYYGRCIGGIIFTRDPSPPR